jgi:hypothetical protein
MHGGVIHRRVSETAGKLLTRKFAALLRFHGCCNFHSARRPRLRGHGNLAGRFLKIRARPAFPPVKAINDYF